MLENSSVELKTLVLLNFTKRLIISKNPMGFFLVKQELPKTKKEEFVEKIKKIGNFESLSENFGQEKIKIQTQRKISLQRPIQTAPILKIPETRLPPQFAYLRPYATNEIDLDLGELNPFLADSAVNVIESNGPDKAVIVKGGMGTKPTNVILSEQEINNIIQIFSKKSKIPAGEGFTKIVLGKYVLSAIVSKETGSKFIITKLPSVRNPTRAHDLH
ncbi:MAG TPA: hypothetical protein VJA20_00015 [Candidatus Nanoarchaeia archaeon]|nr:hypothetical protein [Candidatus Nanoarchaeia archaeon]